MKTFGLKSDATKPVGYVLSLPGLQRIFSKVLFEVRLIKNKIQLAAA